MKRIALGAAVVVGLLAVAGCTNGSDPYYEALDEAGWATGPLDESERTDLYEEMAVQVCGEIKATFEAGGDEGDAMERALRLIDGSDPTSAPAVAALDAMLDHRCDAGQPDGLKAS